MSDAVRSLLPPSRTQGPEGPLVMGIVNVTPDSFSDGGRYDDVDAAVAHGRALWDAGADLLDIGGESTRPGAAEVGVDEEIGRVVPAITALRSALPDAWISIDTRKAAVAEAALAAGATLVNDVSGGDDPGMADVLRRHDAWYVLMHMRGQPATMQHDTAYRDLVGEVRSHLAERLERFRADGVPAHRVILDPGLGFGKAPADNPALVAAVPVFRSMGHPVLIGASRKRFVGALSGVDDPAGRVHGSVGAALAAVAQGADMLRVHDVAATIQALTVFRACLHG